LYNELTVKENLEFYSGVYGIRDHSRLEQVLDLIGLKSLERMRVGQLSAGWRQRLALGTAIIHRPQLLFLDEPTSGVDPSARRDFWDLIYSLVAEGVTAFVTTHYMDEAEYCGRVGIMRDGHLLAIDAPSALKEKALPGLAWDVAVGETALDASEEETVPLLVALNALETCPCVLRAGLVSDHLRAITPPDVTRTVLEDRLQEAGLENIFVEQVEPTLEDVFLALSSK
jgi:ABC-2 type transport system ATP-binding protein